MLIQLPKSMSNYVQLLFSFVHRSKTNHPIDTYTLAQLTLKVRVLYEASKILRHPNQTRSWNIEFDTKSNRVKFDIRGLKWNSSETSNREQMSRHTSSWTIFLRTPTQYFAEIFQLSFACAFEDLR